MRLTPAHVERLALFFDTLSTDAYREPQSELHAAIIRRMVGFLCERFSGLAGASVLDVDCGRGLALEEFDRRGLNATGLSSNVDNVEFCRRAGHSVYHGDISFSDFDNQSFDVVWCRQTLERSLSPFFTLSELFRILAPQGILYIEVPAPDTARSHQIHPDHFSVLGKSMWSTLIERAGFTILETVDLNLTLTGPAGDAPDLIWTFFCSKGERTPTSEKTASISLPTDFAPLYLALPTGAWHGWGNCGRNVALQMSRRTALRLISEPLDENNLSALDVWSLQKVMMTEEERRVIESGRVLEVPVPVLHTIGGNEMRPLYRVRGSFQVGYTFFEDNILPSSALEDARRHFDVIATGSEWCSAILRENGLENVVTVLQGIDPVLFEPTPGHREYFGDRFVVYSGGKFEFRKGQDLVIRAFKVLAERHSDVMLVASWGNPWRSSVQTMSRSTHISFTPDEGDLTSLLRRTLAVNGVDIDRVLLLPRMSNERMARVYKNTDVGLFPNRCEGGTNLVLMEYMACGRPAIASYNSGHRDILTRHNARCLQNMSPLAVTDLGQARALWSEPDLEEVVEQLEWAYQNRERLDRVGRRAGRDMKRHTWSVTATRFQELLAAGRVDGRGAALHDGLRHARSCMRLGAALSETGQVDAAVARYEEALELLPYSVDLRCALGRLHLVRGKPLDALLEAERGLRETPDHGGAIQLLNEALGRIPDGAHEPADAMALALERLAAAALEGDYASFPELAAEIGYALVRRWKVDAGTELVSRALAAAPTSPGVWFSHGLCLAKVGRVKEAVEAYSRALDLTVDRSPQQTSRIHVSRALALLSLGRLASAWPDYEWRLVFRHLARRYRQPPWDGEDAAERTVLVYCEQGMGDIILFARFLPYVRALAGRVAFECPPDLVRLFEIAGLADVVVAEGEALPPFDCHVSLMSLPHVMGLSAPPAFEPYLGEGERWRDRLENGFKVGIVWAGKGSNAEDFDRSMSLRQLAPLLAVPGVRFYSLQKGSSASEVRDHPEIVDMTDALHDFADTAALIATLDLVVTVETSVAHLAGAMGRRVWTLVPVSSAWCWMLEGTETPWYPTMQLFRQSSPQDWTSVVMRVRDHLAALDGSRGSGGGALADKEHGVSSAQN